MTPLSEIKTKLAKRWLTHQALWGSEPQPTAAELIPLTQQEQQLYHDLQQNRFGQNIRLEQERIRYVWLQKHLTLH